MKNPSVPSPSPFFLEIRYYFIVSYSRPKCFFWDSCFKTFTRKKRGRGREGGIEQKHSRRTQSESDLSEARTRIIASRLRGSERAGRAREKGQRTIGSVVRCASASIDTRGGEEDREMERRARDREDRFAGEYRRGIFFCALFGFIFAAYRHRPPDRFSNEFREGGGKRGAR